MFVGTFPFSIIINYSFNVLNNLKVEREKKYVAR